MTEQKLVPQKLGAAKRFVEELAKTRVLSRAEISEAIEGLPPQDPLNAQVVAKALVRQKKITKYQAQVAYQGKAKSLRIGEYLVLDRIGEGGMGQVLKAKHVTMDRAVAIKLLHRKLTSSETMVKRFQQEVRAAAKLMHPNIVSAFDAGQHKNTHYLVMEFVDGKDLATIVRDEGKLSIADATNCILQAARGLAYAHEQGIIHRDVKPANLLLGSDGVLRVLDMGLARVAQDAAAGLTATGQIMGTIDFMPPEQAREAKAVDARGDIYSLGCTLYKLLTAQTLFKRESFLGTMMAHEKEQIPNLMDVRPEASVALNEIFQRMVAKSPDDRPASMTEVVQAFEQLDGGGGTSADLNARLQRPFDDNLTEFFAQLDKPDANTVAPTDTQADHASWITSGHLEDKRRLLAAGLIGSGCVLCLAILAFVFVWGTGTAEDNKDDGDQATLSDEHLNKEDSDPQGDDLEEKLIAPVDLSEAETEKDDEPTPTTDNDSPTDNKDPAVGGGVSDEGDIDAIPPQKETAKTPVESAGSINPGSDDVTDEDVDRRVATRVIQAGGNVVIDVGDGGNIDQVADLPDSEFHILKLILVSDFSLSEDDWRRLASCGDLTELELHDDKLPREKRALTDTVVASLTGLKKIQKLTIVGGDLTDAALGQLATMPELDELTLHKQLISPAGYAQLAKGSNLTTLGIHESEFGDKHLAAVAQSASLQHLHLLNTQITPAGLASLANAKSLTKLRHEQSGVGDLEAAAIASSAPQLTVLKITADALTDDGMKYIAKLQELEELQLTHCGKVTDEGLLRLRTIRGLKRLTLPKAPESSHITSYGIEELKRKRRAVSFLADLEVEARSITHSPLSDGLEEVKNKPKDRHVAECVLKQNGYVGIRARGKTEDIAFKKGDVWPGDDYFVYTLYFHNMKPRNAAEWRCLAELSGLFEIRFVTGLWLCNKDAEQLQRQAWPKLRALSITSDDRLDDDGIGALAKMPLQGLGIHGCDISVSGFKTIAGITGLNMVSLHDKEEFTPEHLEKLCESASLGQFVVKAQASFNDDHLLRLKSAKNLQHLLLIDVGEVTRKGLSGLKACSKLDRLDIGDVPTFGDGELAELARMAANPRGPKLQKLFIPAGQLTDAGVRKIHFPYVDELELRDCRQLSNKAILSLVTRMPSLATLTFSHTRPPKERKFTDAILADLPNTIDAKIVP